MVCVAESLSLLQWRASLLILDVAVGAGLQQRLQRPGLSLIERGGIHQRSEAESIHGVERNAGGDGAGLRAPALIASAPADDLAETCTPFAINRRTLSGSQADAMSSVVPPVVWELGFRPAFSRAANAAGGSKSAVRTHAGISADP